MTAVSGIPLLESSAVSVALPTIQRDLTVASVTVQWLVVAYVLAATVLVAAGGRMADMYGRRRVFLSGLALSAAGALVAAVSPFPWLLICGRALEGAGNALTWPALVAIVVTEAGPDRQGRALGTIAAIGGLGLVVGPLIVEDMGWRWIFVFNAVSLSLLMVVSLVVVPRSEPVTRERLDAAGLLTFASGTFALVLVLMQRRQWPLPSYPALGLLVAGIVLLASFVLIERRAQHPLIHLELLRRRHVQGAVGVGTCVPFLTTAVGTYAAIYLQRTYGYSPLKAGLLLLPSLAVALAVARAAGALGDRAGPRLPIALGCAISAAALFSIAIGDRSEDHLPLLLALGAFGLGVGVAETPARSAAQSALEPRHQGLAAGIFSTSNRLGQTMGAAVIGFLLLDLQDQRARALLGGHRFHLTTTDPSLTDEFLVKARIGIPDLNRVFGPHTDRLLTHVAHQSFSYGFAGAMIFTGVIACLGLGIGLVFFRSVGSASNDGARRHRVFGGRPQGSPVGAVRAGGSAFYQVLRRPLAFSSAR